MTGGALFQREARPTKFHGKATGGVSIYCSRKQRNAMDNDAKEARATDPLQHLMRKALCHARSIVAPAETPSNRLPSDGLLPAAA